MQKISFILILLLAALALAGLYLLSSNIVTSRIHLQPDSISGTSLVSNPSELSVTKSNPPFSSSVWKYSSTLSKRETPCCLPVNAAKWERCLWFNCSTSPIECCYGCSRAKSLVCCNDVLFDLLVNLKSAFDAFNATFFISDGTLLGAFRDQDVLAWTADIDVHLSRAELTTLLHSTAFQTHLRLLGYEFFGDLHVGRVCASAISTSQQDLIKRLGLITHSNPLNKSYMHTMPYADLYTFTRLSASNEGQPEGPENPNSSYIEMYADLELGKQLLLPTMAVFPLEEYDIRGKMFPGIRSAPLYLEKIYGPNYMTPIIARHGR